MFKRKLIIFFTKKKDDEENKEFNPFRNEYNGVSSN